MNNGMLQHSYLMKVNKITHIHSLIHYSKNFIISFSEKFNFFFFANKVQQNFLFIERFYQRNEYLKFVVSSCVFLSSNGIQSIFFIMCIFIIYISLYKQVEFANANLCVFQSTFRIILYKSFYLKSMNIKKYIYQAKKKSTVSCFELQFVYVPKRYPGPIYKAMFSYCYRKIRTSRNVCYLKKIYTLIFEICTLKLFIFCIETQSEVTNIQQIFFLRKHIKILFEITLHI